MLFFILIVLIFIFLLVNLLFYLSVKKVFSQKINLSSDVKISIVVAARNEEDKISKLIDTLWEQSYDKNLFEVIIVDDNSSDKTFELVCEEIKSKPNFLLVKAEDKSLPGKKGALTIGIDKAQNDFIMITDADCIPQKDWIKTYSKIFSKEFDFVFGAAPFYTTNSFVNNLSCFENIRSSILTFTAAIIGVPYSAAARNFGFKKSSFKRLKGYSNTTETLSGDDDLLLREAVKNRMKIGLATEEGSFVYSGTKNNLGDYLKQKARHTETSLHYLPLHKFLLGAWHLINFLFLFSPALIFIDSIFISLLLVKMFIDVIMVTNLQKKFGYDFSLLKIFYLQIVYEIFLIVNFFNAFLGKNDWKE
ncbi:MAG: glycosyltransferase [Ignavibacteriales bacterium]|nr:MAG: glycosyltransferase [Ignavibacteriales bacterium]